MTPVIRPVVVRVGGSARLGGSGPDSGRLAMTSGWEHESLALGATTNLREHRAPMLFTGFPPLRRLRQHWVKEVSMTHKSTTTAAVDAQ
jgi:hypothetical protein